MLTRSVAKVVQAIEQSEGVNARVRRAIGGYGMRNFSPFLMLDEFRATQDAGFPDHPHRGMATVSYMLDGEFIHEDSKGHRGQLQAGGLQWMQAGKGIIHSEIPVFKEGQPAPHGLQLWIDLPKANKLDDPDYQEYKSEEMPFAHPGEDVEIKVICGQTQGSASEGLVKSPIKSKTGVLYYDIKLKTSNATTTQSIPADWAAFAYILEGSVSFGNATKTEAAHHAVFFNTPNAESTIEIRAKSDSARLVLIAGEPLKQQIVQHGPFVMTSKDEIMQAFDDYSRGKNGFEGAAAWKSEQGEAFRKRVGY